jgi:hypothetical protein
VVHNCSMTITPEASSVLSMFRSCNLCLSIKVNVELVSGGILSCRLIVVSVHLRVPTQWLRQKLRWLEIWDEVWGKVG